MNSDYQIERAVHVGRETHTSHIQGDGTGSVRPKKSRTRKSAEEVQREKVSAC